MARYKEGLAGVSSAPGGGEIRLVRCFRCLGFFVGGHARGMRLQGADAVGEMPARRRNLGFAGGKGGAVARAFGGEDGVDRRVRAFQRRSEPPLPPAKPRLRRRAGISPTASAPCKRMPRAWPPTKNPRHRKHRTNRISPPPGALDTPASPSLY